MSKGSAIRWTPEMLKAHQAKTEAASARIRKDAVEPSGLPWPLPRQLVAKPSGQQRMLALGRQRDGTMNKTEARFAAHLNAEKMAGRVLWWAYESIKLKLAPNTHLTVDFAVLTENGHLQMIDVKGARAIYTEDAKAKMKIAAHTFPFAFFVAFPKKGGGWDIEEV